MYTPKFSKPIYYSLGPKGESQACHILEKDNDYRVATYEINRSQGHRVLRDTFSDGEDKSM